MPSLRMKFSQYHCFLSEYTNPYTTTDAHSEVQREILQKHIPVNFSLFPECVCGRHNSNINLLTVIDWLNTLHFATPAWDTYSCSLQHSEFMQLCIYVLEEKMPSLDIEILRVLTSKFYVNFRQNQVTGIKALPK